MIDLKLSAEDVQKMEQPISSNPGDGPKYPYGLCLYLDNTTLEKLGMSSLPAVGEEVTISAKAVVKSVSLREQQDGDKDRSVDLQITAMTVGKPTSNDEKAGRIYPGMS